MAAIAAVVEEGGAVLADPVDVDRNVGAAAVCVLPKAAEVVEIAGCAAPSAAVGNRLQSIVAGFPH